MTKKQIKETLEKQLQLLSGRSTGISDGCELAEVSREMQNIADKLLNYAEAELSTEGKSLSCSEEGSRKLRDVAREVAEVLESHHLTVLDVQLAMSSVNDYLVVRPRPDARS